MGWTEILNESRLPALNSFSTQMDLTDTQVIDPGKLTGDQLCTILNTIDDLEENGAVILPSGLLYPIDATTVRKNVRQVELRRVESKKEAIEQQLTPEGLIKERIAEMREAYRKDPRVLCRDYGGINYRGITSNRNNNYSISGAIRGHQHTQLAGELIVIRRYDRLERLLEQGADMRGIPEREREHIRRVILRIRKRKTMTERLREFPESARKIILTRQAIRFAVVPSTNHEGKTYRNIRFGKLPLAFPDGAFPDLNQEHHATWTDVSLQSTCSCNAKAGFISYVKPGENWFCVHEIAAFRAMAQRDWSAGFPITYPDPYIAASPFFKPTKAAVDFYRKLARQVFVERDHVHEHLPEVYRDTLLLKQVQRGRLELL